MKSQLSDHSSQSTPLTQASRTEQQQCGDAVTQRVFPRRQRASPSEAGRVQQQKSRREPCEPSPDDNYRLSILTNRIATVRL